MSKSDPSEVTPEIANQAAFGDSTVVKAYSGEQPWLFPAERKILTALKSEVAGLPILDVGVGGGRTTPFMLELSSDYLGVDYSPAMIAACRKAHPGVTFETADARDMVRLREGRFGLVFFSFNGIDCVGHEDRLKVIDQAYRLLRPGGFFLFSAHNLRSPRIMPWHRHPYHEGWRPGGMVRNAVDFFRNHFNYLRLKGSESFGSGHAVVVDMMHHFRFLIYYVDPAEQVRQLTQRGFADALVFDKQGHERSLDHPSLGESLHVYYLVRRPPGT